MTYKIRIRKGRTVQALYIRADDVNEAMRLARPEMGPAGTIVSITEMDR